MTKPEEIKTCSHYKRRMCSCKEHCIVRQEAKKKQAKIRGLTQNLLTLQYFMGCKSCSYEGYVVNVIWGPSPGNPGYGCTMWRCPECGGMVAVSDWTKTEGSSS
jgi:hypothetical protein